MVFILIPDAGAFLFFKASTIIPIIAARMIIATMAITKGRTFSSVMNAKIADQSVAVEPVPGVSEGTSGTEGVPGVGGVEGLELIRYTRKTTTTKRIAIITIMGIRLMRNFKVLMNLGVSGL